MGRRGWDWMMWGAVAATGAASAYYLWRGGVTWQNLLMVPALIVAGYISGNMLYQLYGDK